MHNDIVDKVSLVIINIAHHSKKTHARTSHMQLNNYQVTKTSANETVDWGLIPGRVKSKTAKELVQYLEIFY